MREFCRKVLTNKYVHIFGVASFFMGSGFALVYALAIVAAAAVVAVAKAMDAVGGTAAWARRKALEGRQARLAELDRKASEVDRRRAQERAERDRQEAERKKALEQQAEDAEKAAAMAEAEHYFNQNSTALNDVFPRAAFNTWMRLHMAGDVASKQRWDALRELISRLQPLVAQAGERHRQSERQRQQRDNVLREIDERIAEVGQRMERVRRSPLLSADDKEDEIEKLEQEIRNLRARRRAAESDTIDP